MGSIPSFNALHALSGLRSYFFEIPLFEILNIKYPSTPVEIRSKVTFIMKVQFVSENKCVHQYGKQLLFVSLLKADSRCRSQKLVKPDLGSVQKFRL